MERETDQGLAEFERYASQDLIDSIRRNVLEDLNDELRRSVPRPVEKGTEVTAVQILEYLHHCRRTLEAYILERNSGYSALRWMYYSRRIPNYALLEPEGRLDLYKLQLFDAMTGRITTKEAPGIDLLNCPLHEPVLRRALRFSQEIYYLTNFHCYLHQAGKGVPFTFGEWAFPIAKTIREISNSFTLFDWRVSSFNQIPLAGLGTQVHSKPSYDHPEKVFLCVGRLLETDWMNMPEELADGQRDLAIRANYSVQAFDLSKLSELIADGRLVSPIWSEEAGPLLMLMRMACELFLVPQFANHILRGGYVVSTKKTFVEGFSMVYKSAEESVHAAVPGLHVPSTGVELFQMLTEMHSSLWPVVPGPIIRTCGDTAYLDLASATVRLNRAFQFPRGSGLEANLRAEHFEDSVQAAVDSSRWSSAAVRNLKGRTLRRGGKFITDIDAIGGRDGKLLLISCKSVLYAEYDEADYKIMRNAAALVTDAVDKWAKICDLLTKNRIGDNYDFSDYDEIVGVVCTPILVYTPLGRTTDKVAEGLYAAVSLSELRLWLQGTSLERHLL